MSRNIMRKIIADSSSLILLYKCGAAGYFLNCCCCIVPESVMDELTACEYEGSGFFRQCLAKGTLFVKSHAEGSEPGRRLHKGETGVISLYNEGAGEFVLIDDGRGASYCRKEGIPYINALIVVKLLLFSGIISEKDSDGMFGWLKNNGRYPAAVIGWAEKADKDILRGFILF